MLFLQLISIFTLLCSDPVSFKQNIRDILKEDGYTVYASSHTIVARTIITDASFLKGVIVIEMSIAVRINADTALVDVVYLGKTGNNLPVFPDKNKLLVYIYRLLMRADECPVTQVRLFQSGGRNEAYSFIKERSTSRSPS